MNILSKIILTLISLWIFIFLVFVTYITNSFSNFEKPFYKNLEKWLFELQKNEKGVFSFSGISDKSKIIVNKINISDKIIFSTWSIETKSSSWNIIISITPWIYFFNLKEINTNYIISWDWFEINNKWPWLFIVNNLDSKKNIIFSINSVLNLNLKHYKTNEKITSIDLYPHTYLLFNPIKNIFVKNSDLLKVSQTFNLWYLKDKILEDNIVNKDFLDLVSLKIENSKEIINNSILLNKQELEENSKIIQNFIKSSFGTIPGEQFIYKYFIILKNPNKKSIYYKNIIIRNLHELLTNNELDYKIISSIKNNVNYLWEFDKEWYNEILNIINFYYDSINKSNQNINTKINFVQLLININNKNSNSNLPSFLYLEKTFLEYDFLENINFYNDIAIFKQKYFNDLWITKNKTNIKDIEKIDYFLFFLENILISNFSSLENNTKDIITIFSDYIDIANYFYEYSDEKIKRTWIFTYSKILNKFIEIFENKYFNEKRNENNLIEINKNLEISINDILTLEENINKILNFYNNFKIVLKPNINNNDAFIIKLYSKLNEKYKEYFSALKNYEEYVVKYNKSKKELLDKNSINENNNTIVLSNLHATNYLKQFNWVQLNYTNISIMDYNYCLSPTTENSKLVVEIPYCYKIENLLIDSYNVSFLLFPFEKNKINEIVIENQIKSWSYKLDEIKKELDEKMKADSKNKEKYDFSNFLVNTFGQWSINDLYDNNTENYKDDETLILEEDSLIKIFKRNKLLWNSWDFAGLNWFLDINYNDLIVEKLSDTYSIYIKNWIFNIDLWQNKKYYWNFSSKYDFSNYHSFINPAIKIIDEKSKKNLLLWNYIYIIWNYKVDMIQEEIKRVFEHYDYINSIISNINQSLWTTIIKISYLKDSGQILFETDYNWLKINITFENWYITKVTYNSVSKINQKITYTELIEILNNIK